MPGFPGNVIHSDANWTHVNLATPGNHFYRATEHGAMITFVDHVTGGAIVKRFRQGSIITIMQNTVNFLDQDLLEFL